MARNEWDRARGTAASRGYGNKWRVARESFLRHHPLCVVHLERGESVRATVVDHIQPHRGEKSLFWDRSNWQSLCTECHSSHKQRMESGVVRGCDADGLPVDTQHQWHRTRGG